MASRSVASFLSCTIHVALGGLFNAAPTTEPWFEHLISSTADYCYRKLDKDDACCIDVHSAPGVKQEAVNRRGTSWECDGSNCYDPKVGRRGDDGIYVPPEASCATPRILYIHGGSWLYGSPFTDGYPQLLSKMAKLTGFMVFAPDYPLAPVGNFTTMRTHNIAALNYLATHGPHCTNELEDAPPIFIGGDSSGGGSALAVLLTLQKHPSLFAGGAKKLAGGFFFSPWTNLECDTPDYYSHAFSRVVQDRESGSIPAGDGTAFVGDIMFRGHPNDNSGEFQSNAVMMLGGEKAAKKLLKDPIASPLYAEPLLSGAPPMYFAVGGSESIQGDTVLLGQKAAQRDVQTYIDVYDGMWHVFPMYSEGCGSNQSLWQGVSALKRAAFFLVQTAANGAPPCPAGGKRAALVWHYSEPETHDFGDNQEWFPSDFCGTELDGLDAAPSASKPAPWWGRVGGASVAILVVSAFLPIWSKGKSSQEGGHRAPLLG